MIGGVSVFRLLWTYPSHSLVGFTGRLLIDRSVTTPVIACGGRKTS